MSASPCAARRDLVVPSMLGPVEDGGRQRRRERAGDEQRGQGRGRQRRPSSLPDCGRDPGRHQKEAGEEGVVDPGQAREAHRQRRARRLPRPQPPARPIRARVEPVERVATQVDAQGEPEDKRDQVIGGQEEVPPSEAKEVIRGAGVQHRTRESGQPTDSEAAQHEVGGKARQGKRQQAIQIQDDG